MKFNEGKLISFVSVKANLLSGGCAENTLKKIFQNL